MSSGWFCVRKFALNLWHTQIMTLQFFQSSSILFKQRWWRMLNSLLTNWLPLHLLESFPLKTFVSVTSSSNRIWTMTYEFTFLKDSIHAGRSFSGPGLVSKPLSSNSILERYCKHCIMSTMPLDFSTSNSYRGLVQPFLMLLFNSFFNVL